MASKTLFYEISEIIVAKKPCSENNSQIKQVQTVLIGNRNLTHCKPQSYKCQIRNRPNLFLEKIKKNPKKNSFEGSLGWAGVPYGGGVPLTGAKLQFSTMQPTAQGLQFATMPASDQNRQKIVHFSYFPKSWKIAKI